MLAYFLHLKRINAAADLPDFKIDQTDQLSLSVVLCFRDSSAARTPMSEGVRYFDEKTCGYGWSQDMIGFKWTTNHGLFSVKVMCDPPFNPLTFGPLDAFAPLIYALLRHLLKLNVLRWGLYNNNDN